MLLFTQVYIYIYIYIYIYKSNCCFEHKYNFNFLDWITQIYTSLSNERKSSIYWIAIKKFQGAITLTYTQQYKVLMDIDCSIYTSSTAIQLLLTWSNEALQGYIMYG